MVRRVGIEIGQPYPVKYQCIVRCFPGYHFEIGDRRRVILLLQRRKADRVVKDKPTRLDVIGKLRIGHVRGLLHLFKRRKAGSGIASGSRKSAFRVRTARLEPVGESEAQQVESIHLIRVDGQHFTGGLRRSGAVVQPLIGLHLLDQDCFLEVRILELFKKSINQADLLVLILFLGKNHVGIILFTALPLRPRLGAFRGLW